MRQDDKKETIDKKDIIIGISMLISIVLILINSLMLKELNIYKKYSLNSLLEVIEAYNSVYCDIEKYDIDLGESLIESYISIIGDKYGKYINKEESEEYKSKIEGNYSGVGVDFGITNGLVYITRVVKDSPAYNKIQVGDIVKSINKQDLKDSNLVDIKNIIDNSNNLIFSIERDSELIDININKGEFIDSGLDYEIKDNNIAYIRILKFNDETSIEFDRVVQELEDSGISKYILDLRNNTGGIVESAIDIIDSILPSGKIVRVESRNGAKEYYSDEESLDGDIVVITNGMTASASEMLVQALKDYNKATVVGEKTFGKGSELATIQLKTGGLLILTDGRYYTSSNVEIEGIGIEPDISIVEDDYVLVMAKEKEDIQLNKAIELLSN